MFKKYFIFKYYLFLNYFYIVRTIIKNPCLFNVALPWIVHFRNEISKVGSYDEAILKLKDIKRNGK